MTPIITYKYLNSVAAIRLKKLGKLRAGPHCWVGRADILEEVTRELKSSQRFLSQRMWVPGQVIEAED